MATEQAPLLFFRTMSNADPLAVAQSILGAAGALNVVQLDPEQILRSIRRTRGFARLMIAPPRFSFENPRAGAAFEGMVCPSHIHVGFHGDFDKIAELLFNVLTSLGLQCYSIWDKRLLTEWPKWSEPTIDKGFAARMTGILERKTIELRETVPDEKRRSAILDAFVKSPEFRAEMAAEARRESPRSGKKTYADAVNCYARWKTGRVSASEIGAVRKLHSKYAAMSISELRAHIGDSPRLLLLTAADPRQAAELRSSAEKLGISVDVEPP